MTKTLYVLFVFTLFGKVCHSQEAERAPIKPDWSGSRNFQAVLKQMDVAYMEERKVYYFDFALKNPTYLTQEVYGDTCLRFNFENVNHDSGFRLSKSDKSYWYYVLFVNDTVCMLDDRNIRDFLTPLNTIEKVITYFYYVVNIVPDRDYDVFDGYITVEEDGFSFLVLDMDHRKSSRFHVRRIIDVEFERTPLLKLKINRNGEYAFVNVRSYREIRNLKHCVR